MLLYTSRIQSRCYILVLPPILLSPPLICPVSLPMKKQQKLNYRNGWNNFLHRCWREKHITSCVSLLCDLSLSLAPCLFLLWFDRRSKWGIPHTLVLRRGITSTRLSFSLSLNKMIHFSITAMSVWNELYNQQHRFVNSSHTQGKMCFLFENNMLPMCAVRNTNLTAFTRTF